MPGALPRNLHEGSRSETLARFCFQAFGPAFLVPREEDFGIDLYGALATSTGQKLLVEDYYIAQIKSTKEPILYNDRASISWLLNHRYPFLVCHVDKSSSSVEIFQTLGLTTMSDPGPLETLALIFGNSPTVSRPTSSHAEVCLGKAIVRMSPEDVSPGEKHEAILDTLRSWIRLVQWNINSRQFGGGIFNVAEKWETNVPVVALILQGDGKEAIANPAFQDSLYQVLAQLCIEALCNEDRQRFRVLADLVQDLAKSGTALESWGFRALIIAFNTAAEYLGEGDRLGVRIPDGSYVQPSKIQRT